MGDKEHIKSIIRKDIGQFKYDTSEPDFVVAMYGKINKYDGKPKYYAAGATKKQALNNLKKEMRI